MSYIILTPLRNHSEVEEAVKINESRTLRVLDLPVDALGTLEDPILEIELYSASAPRVTVLWQTGVVINGVFLQYAQTVELRPDTVYRGSAMGTHVVDRTYTVRLLDAEIVFDIHVKD